MLLTSLAGLVYTYSFGIVLKFRSPLEDLLLPLHRTLSVLQLPLTAADIVHGVSFVILHVIFLCDYSRLSALFTVGHSIVLGACDGTFQGGFCDETSANCLGNCSGQQWCSCSSPTTSAPQPTPTPPPVPTATPPPFADGNIATTTRYWDCSGGGCGYLAGGDTSKETHCRGYVQIVF